MNIGLPQPEIVRSDTRRVVNLNLPEPVVIVSTLFAFGGVVTSAWKLTAVSALILIIIGFARGWAKVSLSRVELSREVAQHRLYVGETTSLELIMENRKTLPLPWLRVDFSLPDGLAISSGAEFGSTRSNYEFTQSFCETFSVGSRERVRAERLLLAARRGSYRRLRLASFRIYARHMRWPAMSHPQSREAPRFLYGLRLLNSSLRVTNSSENLPSSGLAMSRRQMYLKRHRRRRLRRTFHRSRS